MGLVDIHEAATGREARSGNDLTSNERWSRWFLGAGTFLLSALPFAPSSRAAPAVAGETAEAAAARALLEADVRASLQAAQAERRAAALSRGERQAMVPERPAGPPGEGPVPRPEPVPPPVEAPGGTSVGSNGAARSERLTEYYNRLRGQTASGTADEALGRVGRTLEEVEDALSGIPSRNPPPTPNMPDGRMYPPQADNIVRHADGSITARTRGHDISIGRDGSITMTNRQTGNIDFQQPGTGN